MKSTNKIFAKTFKERLQGVKGLKNPKKGTQLVFKNCRVIHTFGMKYNLSISFIDKNGKELKNIDKMRPWRIAIGPTGTTTTIETII